MRARSIGKVYRQHVRASNVSLPRKLVRPRNSKTYGIPRPCSRFATAADSGIEPRHHSRQAEVDAVEERDRPAHASTTSSRAVWPISASSSGAAFRPSQIGGRKAMSILARPPSQPRSNARTSAVKTPDAEGRQPAREPAPR